MWTLPECAWNNCFVSFEQCFSSAMVECNILKWKCGNTAGTLSVLKLFRINLSFKKTNKPLYFKKIVKGVTAFPQHHWVWKSYLSWTRAWGRAACKGNYANQVESWWGASGKWNTAMGQAYHTSCSSPMMWAPWGPSLVPHSLLSGTHMLLGRGVPFLSAHFRALPHS